MCKRDPRGPVRPADGSAEYTDARICEWREQRANRAKVRIQYCCCCCCLARDRTQYCCTDSNSIRQSDTDTHRAATVSGLLLPSRLLRVSFCSLLCCVLLCHSHSLSLSVCPCAALLCLCEPFSSSSLLHSAHCAQHRALLPSSLPFGSVTRLHQNRLLPVRHLEHSTHPFFPSILTFNASHWSGLVTPNPFTAPLAAPDWLCPCVCLVCVCLVPSVIGPVCVVCASPVRSSV